MRGRSGRAFRAFREALLALLFGAGTAAAGPGSGSAAGPAAGPGPAPADVAQPPGLPAVGKWMLDADLTPAHWLGEVYEGKRLREPINLILLDRGAGSADEAVVRLLEACKAAGYPSRFGHSTGYRAYIGDKLHPQLPDGRDRAFASAPFEIDNDHGRIFGPYAFDGGYLFIGAFSREKVDPVARIKHRFVSFDRARDEFADALERHGRYRRTGFAALDNALLDHSAVSTGDHDGQALVLTAR